MSQTYDALPVQPHDTPTSSIPVAKPRRSRTLRFGSWGTWVLAAGIPLQLGILAILGYIWSSQRDVQSNNVAASTLWRRLALAGWVLQTITILSAVMRVTLGLHTVLATSIAAAIMFEGEDTPWFDLCKLSLLRVANNGPWTLLWMRIWNPQAVTSTMLLAILFISSMVLQFSSTILVSDLQHPSIAMDPQTVNTSVLDFNGLYTNMAASKPWSKPPAFFPTFAETGPVDQVLSTPQFPLVDTGTRRRGLLPFPSERRQKLRSYTGPAVVLESRVGCVPVDLDVKLTPSWDDGSWLPHGVNTTGRGGWPGLVGAYLDGSASWNYTTADGNAYNFLNKSQGTDATYTCSERTCHRAPLNCTLAGETPANNSAILTNVDKARIEFCFFDKPDTEKFLLFQVPLTADDWTDVFERQFPDVHKMGPISLQKSHGAGQAPWSVYTAAGVNIHATVCSIKSSIKLEQVSMHTPVDIKESSITWENNTWNTQGVQKLFSSPSLTLAEKSTLALNISSPADAVEGSDPSNFSSFGLMVTYVREVFRAPSSTRHSRFNPTILLCGNCMDRLESAADIDPAPAYIILLQAILHATGDPTRALDALFTALWLTTYENSMAGFDYGDDAVIVSSTVVQLPGRWSGFIIVACLMTAAYSCIGALVVIYLRNTRYTLLGSSWYAVAQLLSEELAPVLETASTLPDGELQGNKNDESRHVEARLVTGTDMPELRWTRKRSRRDSSSEL